MQDGNLLVFCLAGLSDSSYTHAFLNFSCLNPNLNRGILRSKVKGGAEKKNLIWFNMQINSCKNPGIYPEMLFGEEGRGDIHSFPGTSGDVSSYVHPV